MYGKHFAQMYEGSMVGAGPVVFAVMGYIIAKQVPDRVVGSQVELNPKLLAYILGADQLQVEEAVRKLCDPDPESRSPEHEGRRLIKIGQFAYQVVNGAKYRYMLDEEKRRTQNREAKQRERAKKKPPAPAAVPGERAYLEAERNGATEEQLDEIVTRSLPPHRERDFPVSEQPSSNHPEIPEVE